MTDPAGSPTPGSANSLPSRTAAPGGYFPDHTVNPGLIDVDDPDRGTFPREAKSARPPHPRSCRRNDADLAVEPHGVFPCCR